MLKLPTGDADLESRLFHGPDGEVRLTAREARLLAYLAGRPARTATREDLLVDVWGYEPGVRSRTVDATVHRLRRKIERDPSEPEVILSLYGEGYRLEVDEAPARGPAAPALLGRDALVGHLHDQLDAAGGWIPLVGPVGVGKTRLATTVSEGSRLPSHLVRVDHAQTIDALRAAVSAALGLGSRGQGKQLEHALAGAGATLLVVDNLEQLPDGAGALLSGWCERAPELRLLTTSRRALPGGPPTVEVPALDTEASMQLLVERATAVRPAFTVFPEQQGPLQSLCERLDHLPLALELAGSRLALFSPSELLERLEKGRRLVGLDAAIQSSWELLSPTAQRVLAWAGLFPGPFRAAMLEQVAHEADGAMAGIDELVRHRMMQEVPGERSPRLVLLASIRAFARARLQTRDDQEAARAAFRDATVEWAAQQVAGLHGPAHAVAERKLGEETELLSAVARRLPLSDATELCTLALGLRAAAHRVPLVPVLQVLSDAIRAASRADRPDLEAHLRLARATLRRSRGVDDGVASDLEQALALARAAQMSELEPRIEHRLANRDRHQGRLEEAESGYLAAEAGYAETGDAYGALLVRLDRALAARRRGDRELARTLLVRCISEADQLGLTRVETRARGNLASVLRELGEVEGAEQMGRAALDAARRSGDRMAEATCLTNRGNLLVAIGRLHEGQAALEEARSHHRRLGSTEGEAYALGTLAVLEVLADRWAEAEVRWRAAADLHAANGDSRAEAASLAGVGMARLVAGDADAARSLFEQVRAAADPRTRAMVEGYDWLCAAEQGDGVPAPSAEVREGPLGDFVAWLTRGELPDDAVRDRLRSDPTTRGAVVIVERVQRNAERATSPSGT